MEAHQNINYCKS